MSDFVDHLLGRCGFQTIEKGDRRRFLRYGQDADSFDLSFTNFYSWNERFRYVCREIGDAIAVAYTGLDGESACILLPGPSCDLRDDICRMSELFMDCGLPALFEYVPESWLPYYRGSGFAAEVSWDRDWSDYLYDTKEFIALEGGANKFKRRELNAFQTQGSVGFVPLTSDNFSVALQVFDSWCAGHDCSQCVFGCERRAFARLADIWEGQFYGGIALLGGEPVAFAAAETLGGCACYSFQKNARRVSGLTYYLHYHCALLPGHPKRMNWCEDMGLEGLRRNKMKYKPCALPKKYSVRLLYAADTEGR